MPGPLAMVHGNAERDRRPWHGAAFIVEALVLLLFLVASLAVLFQVMGTARERAAVADRLSSAAILASNDAESFAADPTGDQTSMRFQSVDGVLDTLEGDEEPAEGATVFEVTRSVRSKPTGGGTMYEARIEVTCEGEQVYALDTSRYRSDEGATL